MTCNTIKPLIYDCLSGELDAEEERTLRLHLRGCPACRSYYREIEAIVRGIRRMEAIRPSEKASLETLGRVAGGSRFRLTVLLPRPAYALAAAAGLIIIASALIYTLRTERGIEMDERASTIAQRERAGADVKKLSREYLEESDLILTMTIEVSRGKAPYTIGDVKSRIVAKDLLYTGAVLSTSAGGEKRLCGEIDSILKEIMRVKAAEDGKEVRAIALSIRKSELLDRIARERGR